ncbi:hypothetical protein [Paenibacillus harenae]|uniref:hypothetical protein n=1 Tax=Paenibacillus harenae TaxID=306543 RepID=UPI00278FD870|nr:hypothetical protein [Paenibacillus harenae]MDQ0063307.1 hypothetical protein [Paenibacillus harenae]
MLVHKILKHSRGKAVVLKTVSGEEIIGVVIRVKGGVVQLKNQTRRNIFVVINKIVAVVK